ncbi:MAG: sigma 54-interacting transcriptional regulator, partial [Planctomycetaceae bacterium]|nr:sigma 54-interacting transcriptional regulator [Planctomycetaceae bacterium]
MASLSSLQNPTLFFDARLSEFDAESEALINSLMTDLDAVNVIVLGDGIYPLRISAELNLLEAGHLLVTNDGGIRDPDEILDRVVRTARPRPIPRLCQVTAEGITVGSYNPEMAPMLNDLMRVAHRDVTLLIVGETGTGKTTLAKFIHSRSP